MDLRGPRRLAHIPLLDNRHQRFRLFLPKPRNGSPDPRAGRERRRSNVSRVRKREPRFILNLLCYAK